MFFNRSAINAKKLDRDFNFQIGSRLKIYVCNQVFVVNDMSALLQISLTFCNRPAIFTKKSDPDFKIIIDFRLSFFNRTHDRDQKPVRDQPDRD
ncbi:MAG: hypothetical protein CVV32_02665 [Methanomicrobiales archaeon HGW-Methanomicrobiales-3]|nr:MAG: hypothetical protein CVV32_02665 [Methanomicrobiales archaeon HGW-Methanomicrobiales-3]